MMVALEGIHDWSMSKDEHRAVTGRCLKRFYEDFDNFDREECDRGIHRGIVIYGMIHAMGIIAAVTALSGVRDGHKDLAVAKTIELFSEVVTNVSNAPQSRRVDRDDR